MKVVTYWETAPGKTMPSYVALSLVSMQRVLGDSFLLLTPENIVKFIGDEFLKKSWTFTPLGFEFAPEVASIVAKSDFIRMAYIYHQGGMWLDADTILFDSLRPEVFPEMEEGKLYWYSEALFGATRGNSTLERAMDNCLSRGAQQWANPGNIRSLICGQEDAIVRIPENPLDPGYRPRYKFSTCNLMFDEVLSADAFLQNPELKLLKLYNTYFSRSKLMKLTVKELLQSDVLLSKIFLHIESDPQYWIAQSKKFIR